ncbi:MAG: hypothetical protein P9M00_04675 [Candidatus Tritonobacter lacicola]|nr:hypothetical protein [Candidatus Tritonobacter lacicola]
MRIFRAPAFLPFISCLAIIFIAISAWLPWRSLTWDEPHIFYQYAKNFAEGRGLVFNHDERVLGFTSPLFQCVLAAAALFTSNLPYLGNLLFVISLAGFSIVVFLAMRRINLGLWGFVTAIGLIIWPVPYNYMGMETLTLSFFVFTAFYFFIGGRFALAAVFVSLAVLTRFDGIIPAAILLIMYVVQEKRCPWKLFAIGAAILIPWFVFSLLYYGAILPQTFYAKRSLLSLSGFMQQMVWKYCFSFNVIRSQELLPLPWFVLPLVGIFFGVRKSKYFALIFLYMAGIGLGYALTGRMEEAWPLFPVMAGMRIFMFYGIYQVAALCGRLARVKRWYRPVCAAVLLFLTVPVLLHDFEILEKMPGSGYVKYFFVARMKVYEDTGTWLRKNAGPASTVFTGEPGTLAYHSGCIFFDYYGLVTRRGWKVPLKDVGRELRADYIVLPDDYLAELGPELPPEYEVVGVFETSPYPPVRISRRKDLARESS